MLCSRPAENQTCTDLSATISRHLLPPISWLGKTVDSYRRSCRNGTSHRKRGFQYHPNTNDGRRVVFSLEIQNDTAEADAASIPVPGQLELHGKCRYGVSCCLHVLVLTAL